MGKHLATWHILHHHVEVSVVLQKGGQRLVALTQTHKSMPMYGCTSGTHIYRS